jgi:GETHR pentapeptide repeat (5 copies)
MAGMLQMRRSRGAFSGFLLMLLGLWGALIPFVGPYFDYAYTPDKAWTYNTGRLWLEILPGAAVFLGGFLLTIARGRHTALFGALLAAAAGAWFTLGTVLSPLWNHHVPMGGSPASNTVYMRIMEQLGFFTALGVVIVFIAAVALGRIASVPSGIREVEEIPETTVPADTVPVETVRNDTGRDETDRGETDRGETDRGETVRSEETRPAHTRLLPRRKTEDTTQTVG